MPESKEAKPPTRAGVIGEARAAGLPSTCWTTWSDGARVVVTPVENYLPELFCVYLVDHSRWLFVSQPLLPHQVFAVMQIPRP
jgi:hypothetical protein